MDNHSESGLTHTPSVTASSGSQKPSRRYAFACSNCRRKKVRCGGEKPSCSNCTGSLQETCRYQHQRAVEMQLKQAQEKIILLQKQLDGALPHRIADNSITEPVTRALERPPYPYTGDSEASNQESRSREDLEIFWSQVSLGDEGSPTYHGSTSRFHLEVDKANVKRLAGKPKESSEVARLADLPTLRSNAELLRRVWEPLAYAGLQEHEGISPAMGSTLLKIYWTWQHPLHNCVYRPCFFRDMALGGPYYSELLLMSIYALAARHADESDPHFIHLGKGEGCLERAKTLLVQELSQPKPKISTIQALLILGGRQCAIGNSSEGWLYTGMAIRMMKDVGLHLNSHSLQAFEDLAPADLEARKRLFFSAYIWDKSISLCLGRPPTLVEMPHAVDDLLDNFDDDDLWTPVCLGGMQQYPITPGFNTSTFKEFCRIGEIITQIYSVVYNDRKIRCEEEDIRDIEARLYSWFAKLPVALRMDDISCIEYCPPPHILSLNLVYHTLLILVFRPFLRAAGSSQLQQHAKQICSAQSIIINDLFLLYGHTFNYKVMTYLVSYCVYTAATINVHDMKHSDASMSHEVAARLNVSLQVLESEARQTPGIRQSINIIKRQLSNWDVTTQPDTLVAGSYQEGDQLTVIRDTSLNANVSNEAGLEQVSRNLLIKDCALSDDMNATVDMDGMTFAMYESSFIDASGGFQPDAFHWALNDTSNIGVNYNLG
ncbi:Uncharacterized protein BP5553_07823 [Venustampulla echinocandica]|uniref:Zn(2)-C6 fungal-type domain-containing protein n=1 Tax=Venustampulla echinocandica TaxID=2656787 RepID=A0A370THL9_9HELO|nr:Uncharacterized protein BP5553_07823 [Venustampulla echinocandica]RDL34695.1 Uncharacterized protein BP5553_07823 [Venustampulla echinocandica]